MPAILGKIIVIAVLTCVIAMAVRSIWKSHRNGKGSCGGDCAHCKGCH